VKDGGEGRENLAPCHHEGQGEDEEMKGSRKTPMRKDRPPRRASGALRKWLGEINRHLGRRAFTQSQGKVLKALTKNWEEEHRNTESQEQKVMGNWKGSPSIRGGGEEPKAETGTPTRGDHRGRGRGHPREETTGGEGEDASRTWTGTYR
jgi:hypothetical protein